MTNTQKHIALLLGGKSSEREVSLMTGSKVAEALKELGYKVTEIDVGSDIAQKLALVNPDLAFIALHGKYGEDGCIQGLLEIMGIPYTHSGVTASAIAMDKHYTKIICSSLNIKCPKGKTLSAQEIIDGKIDIPYPYVIKATNEGSSIGVYIVKDKNDFPNIDDIKKNKYYVIEEFIEGRELSVATTDKGSLGVIEIKPKTNFYNYKNKYTDNTTDYAMPANIDKKNYDTAMEWAYKLHKELNCKGLTRSDFIISNDNKLFMLEINTHPGLTKHSLAPKIAKHINISYNELVQYIVENAGCQK